MRTMLKPRAYSHQGGRRLVGVSAGDKNEPWLAWSGALSLGSGCLWEQIIILICACQDSGYSLLTFCFTDLEYFLAL